MHSIDNSEYVEETMRIEKEKWRRKKLTIYAMKLVFDM